MEAYKVNEMVTRVPTMTKRMNFANASVSFFPLFMFLGFLGLESASKADRDELGSTDVRR